MSSDLRHTRRQNDFIPVSVTVRSEGNGRKLAGPLGGRIINISPLGACLLLSPADFDAEGMPGGAVDRNCPLLEIKGTLPGEEKPFTLTARPVWSTTLIMDDLRGWRLGVEFADQQEGRQMTAISELIGDH